MKLRKPTNVKAGKTRLSWPQVKGRIIAATTTGTVAEFARSIGYTPQSLRIALDGKAPRTLARMEAILGSLAA